MHEVPAKPAPSADDGGIVRADAGDAQAPGWDRLRTVTSHDASRTAAEDGGSRDAVGATNRPASADEQRVVPSVEAPRVAGRRRRRIASLATEEQRRIRSRPQPTGDGAARPIPASRRQRCSAITISQSLGPETCVIYPGASHEKLNSAGQQRRQPSFMNNPGYALGPESRAQLSPATHHQRRLYNSDRDLYKSTLHSWSRPVRSQRKYTELSSTMCPRNAKPAATRVSSPSSC